jgi:hypothetical protein
MIRGNDFYAVWDEEERLWSMDESVVVSTIDNELQEAANEYQRNNPGTSVSIAYMWDSDSGSIDRWHKYCQKQMRNHFQPLDKKIIFNNTNTVKRDYASQKLPYDICDGDISSYNTLMNTIYSEEERKKLEWGIGSIIEGDSKTIQKFFVLYGGPGTGKSTVLKIIQHLFDGYCTMFDAKDLGNDHSSFALEAFKNNPLVAIQHDADLSRIEDNTKLNSIVSHESMEFNLKYQPKFSQKVNSMLFVGSNELVKITDAKSGIVRRLIDVNPTGNKVQKKDYDRLMKDILNNELGSIASYCLQKYNELGPDYYEMYVPVSMISGTNDFYNFVEDNVLNFMNNDPLTLNLAWEWYKSYIDDANLKFTLNKTRFKVELKNYYKQYDEQGRIGPTHKANVYSGFIKNAFKMPELVSEPKKNWLDMKKQHSIFDDMYKSCYAQYADEKSGVPTTKWINVKTKLLDLDTSKLHYVKVPYNHIVIDLDLTDKDGKKSRELNIEAAKRFPETYAELSKSGCGVHLHYLYSGNVDELSRLFDNNIEIKVFSGGSSLRRKLGECNDIPISTLDKGFLPLKGDTKKMINWDGVKNEKMLRLMIEKNLNKEYHNATKPSIDYIYDLLEDAYNNKIPYDVSTMKNSVLSFAMNSTHQKDYCLKKVAEMKFKSEDISEAMEYESDDLVFFDTEVFPNFFCLCYKLAGKNVVKLIQPTPEDIIELVKRKLVGFNCRKYDNHILYARMLGYTNEQLFELSTAIVNKRSNCFFGEAYNISYTDILDFSSEKQSLKKFEIDLGIHHQENHYPWDKPLPKEHWDEVADYCANDVIATEATFNSRSQDFLAREILVSAANILCPSIKSTVNDTTNTLTTRIIFRGNKNSANDLVYTDLSTGKSSDGTFKESNKFEGYKYEGGKSTFMGDQVGEGGYVYSEPGIYHNVALLDVASMHPHSIKELNLFGKYTSNFTDLMDARIAVKHNDWKTAKTIMSGALASYITDDISKEQAKALAGALKIAINSVYGLTSAKFDNPFRDIRNADNIVAKRGALFMIMLKNEVKKRGFTVAHIKTDSIKIPNANENIIQFVTDFGKKYGYTFEHEATFEKYCLVNDAVYICKVKEGEENGAGPGEWSATGTQFQQPYVFKTLFSHEPLEFKDICETKSVTTALYLDFNEKLKDGEHDYRFVGKVGQFTPIKPGFNGGILVREGTNEKMNSATGAKGYRWMESEDFKELEDVKKRDPMDDVDKEYYRKLVDDAVSKISKYGDFDEFVSDEPYLSITSDELPF